MDFTSDIPHDLAARAHAGTSHVPERSVEAARREAGIAGVA